MKEFKVYSFLKNKVYLYWLSYFSYYGEGSKINYAKMAKELGLSRQKVTNQFQELINGNNPIQFIKVEDNKIMYVYNYFALDTFLVKDVLKAQLSDVATAYILMQSIQRGISNQKFCEEVQISTQTLYKHKDEIDEALNIIQTEFIVLISCYNKVWFVEKHYNLRHAMNWFISRDLAFDEDNFTILKRCTKNEIDDEVSKYKQLLQPCKNAREVG
ncbi:MAG: hypothetical protein LIO71_03255 [Ruminococcus sp.]|nr:hypothetical protein [Ruminococcus sp.]